MEALEEVAVQSSNYSAEFGQAGSGLFQYTTRSGSNQWHGSLYDYFVNEALNASQPFSHIRNVARRNDFGGSIGGPVIIPKLYNGRDRTFFFFNFEAFKENATISDQTRTVPIQAYRDGDFSSLITGRRFTGGLANDGLGNPMHEGMIFDPLTDQLAPNGTRARLQFAGNIIPVNRFDPSAVKFQARIPAPTSPGFINNFNNAFQSNRLTPATFL